MGSAARRDRESPAEGSAGAGLALRFDLHPESQGANASQKGKSMNEPTLFVSLGHSPAVVPEAFLLPGVEFRSVHVLTTEEPRVDLVREFFSQHAPGVRLTVARVAGFRRLDDERDHFHFEEVLYRWILAAGAEPGQRYFCLSGGFKTMSAGMQKAAAMLGAAEVFHVLADRCCPRPDGQSREPETPSEILMASRNGHLHYVKLGPEPGWPALRGLTAADFPLQSVAEREGIRWVRAPDDGFRRYLQQILERTRNITSVWDHLHELPFSVLATWPSADREWLAQPLDPNHPVDRDWLARLPKIELHCHLGGFATHGPMLHRIRSAATDAPRLPPLRDCDPPAGWPLPDQPVALRTYMHLGDNNGTHLLRDPGCLREQCRALYEHLVGQQVLYAEIRCSPANYADPSRGRSPWDVLVDIRQTFQQCMEASARRAGARAVCHVNLILIATRKDQGDYRADIVRHLALAVTAAEHWTDPTQCRVVGVDLAGYEDVTTRAHYYREEFTAVHRCGLAVTVHAGENDDAEGIWRAVFDLNARRLGHALSLRESPQLLRSVADRGIGVELCPYANYQIKGFPLDTALPPENPRVYPLRYYLDCGLRVTLNTDNIGISGASLADNLLLAARLCPGLSRLDLLRLQRHAIETAFCPAAERLALMNRLAKLIPRP